jgi:hypothetical protein
LWAINGGRLVELHRDWAVVEPAANVSRRIFQRRNKIDPGKVALPWIGFCQTPAREATSAWKLTCNGAESSKSCRRVSDDHPGGRKILDINPMHRSLEARLAQLARAPRCGARTRSGTECQSPAIRGCTRCRMHGGKSPGAPKGERNGNFKNGDWTQETRAERHWLRDLVRGCTERTKK